MADKNAQRRHTEAEARLAREAARKHLEDTGTGQSQYEIKGVHRQVGYDIDMGDNTLQVVADRRARAGGAGSGSLLVQMPIPKALTTKAMPTTAKKNDRHSNNGLLPGWRETVDKESGDVYYWNKETKETTWDKPLLHKPPPPHPSEVLPAGWEAVKDPDSDDVYYWNIHSMKTQWERPVSLEQAIEAKSKLDHLLQFCGTNTNAIFGGADDNGDVEANPGDTGKKRSHPHDVDDPVYVLDFVEASPSRLKI
ncbi:Aste57867_193 [Aphanomyces stellatus]|uniref:Aste57867_193 protein n=1 Tax=Aphanomyces stellatus TaxID=120398 RepID=A0A485K653_9STRA|nr:hypothetical protein As57867_000193 [Aphanomyces stellatus]VFT77419.1 Aste57867_193 [Aphanomyces stellatus]